MTYTTKQIFTILRNIKHPKEDKDILSLGMIQELIIEGYKISFTLVFQTNTDPNIENIKKACIKAIESELGENAQIKGNIKLKYIKKEDDQSGINKVKNIIAVASGKGGVGKSTIAVNLSVALANTGAKVALLDADIYGPSVPKMLNIEDARPEIITEDGKEWIIPIEKYGVKTLSIGFFSDPKDALIWRGAMATGAIKQLLLQSKWNEIDYMIVDLPPGTGDIHLTMVQTVPINGGVVVSTPQEIALVDVRKAMSMFKQDSINIPVLGVVENMAWFTPEELPNNKYYIFGKEGAKKYAENNGHKLLEQIPIVMGIREGGDSGVPAAVNKNSIMGKKFAKLANNLIKSLAERNSKLPPTKIVEVSKK